MAFRLSRPRKRPYDSCLVMMRSPQRVGPLFPHQLGLPLPNNTCVGPKPAGRTAAGSGLLIKIINEVQGSYRRALDCSRRLSRLVLCRAD